MAEDQPRFTLDDMQHWTWVMGRAQQMMLEAGLETMQQTPAIPTIPGFTDAATIERAQAFWADSMRLWQRFLDPAGADGEPARPDRRFQAPEWENPVFDWIRQSYMLIADHILRGVDALQPGDALLIAGKGHETGQIIGHDIYPFDDAEQASVAVAALDGRI